MTISMEATMRATETIIGDGGTEFVEGWGGNA